MKVCKAHPGTNGGKKFPLEIILNDLRQYHYLHHYLLITPISFTSLLDANKALRLGLSMK